MIEKLLVEEKEGLKRTLKETREKNEYQRILCVLNYDEGMAVEKISRVTYIAERNVYEYLNEYSQSKKKSNGDRGGSQEKLSEEQSEELKEHLRKNTYLSSKNIAHYVKRIYGIKYTVSGMNLWLIRHGFKYKKPATIPGKLDVEEQRKFIEGYRELKENLREDEAIYFMDGVHPANQSQAVSGWIYGSEKKHLRTSGKQTRLHFLGAVSLEKEKVITRNYETLDQRSVIDFLSELEKKNEGKKIILIADNAAIHKGSQVREYLARSRIKLLFLPAYSPNLNPIERMWKYMRRKIIYNRYYEKFEYFSAAVFSFFKRINRNYPRELQSLLTDNFQVFQPNFLHLST